MQRTRLAFGRARSCFLVLPARYSSFWLTPYPVPSPVYSQGTETGMPFPCPCLPRPQPRVPQNITHLGRPGSVEGTRLVNLCCSWRRTIGVHDRRPDSGVCPIERSGRESRENHIPASGTLSRSHGCFSSGPGSCSNWNCTQSSSGFLSGPPVYPGTWSWYHLESPGDLGEGGSKR